MRPRKSTPARRPGNPEVRPPVSQEESERRREFFESKRPRKKVLILDKDDKEPDRASPAGKTYRRPKDLQDGKAERSSFNKGADVKRGRAPVKAGYRKKREAPDQDGFRKKYDVTERTGFRKKPVAPDRNHEGPTDENRRPSGKRPFREPAPFKRTGTGKSYGRSSPDPDLIRLNRFISNAGICSRREADELIRAGAIRVNGKIVTELGVKVSRTDKIQYGDQTLRAEPMVYVLLNKPKGYITTVDDPDDRKTVMTLVKDASRYRIYPVGRLDRNTTGLLLFTNDGDLAKKLTHPRHRIDKLYHVELDKNVSKNDLLTIAGGVELEDGFVKVDEIAWVAGADSKKEVGIRLHSGKNRIVRRIFEKLDYKVVRLDRVIFAGLTKKDIPRGRWRHLTKEEVNRLKRL